MQIETEGFSLHLKNPSYAANPHPVLNSPKQILFPELSELASLIDQERLTAGELALYFEEKHFIPAAETFHCLNTIFSFGLLQEGPE